ncbi:MAG: hypothetical protein OXU77_09195 [Gammaproteobacteria bacterium]|nr:hypothetical protein [Gammaproteobacteria bacterium]MDE0442080.1 hypothetical protein [Gammaproteobacteria bacterium]
MKPASRDHPGDSSSLFRRFRRGRVAIRPSGTEPVVRVMVEDEDADEVNEQAASVASVVEQANG